jgi:hypothetical protein
MTRSVNPIVIRLSTTKIWSNLWFSKYNYSDILNQDFFIKNYIRVQLKYYGIGVVNFNIKRSLNSIFITLTLFNCNFLNSHQFLYNFHISSISLIRSIFDYEVGRFSFSIYKLTGQSKVRFFIRTIKKQRYGLRAVLLSASPILLSKYFFMRYFKMGSYKPVLKVFKRIFNKPDVLENNTNIKGLKLLISGPIKAPRNRRSFLIKNIFFGSTPFQTFNNYVDFFVKSKSLSEGVVTAKFFFFKKIKLNYLEKKKIKSIFKSILGYYRGKYRRISGNTYSVRFRRSINVLYEKFEKLSRFYVRRRYVSRSRRRVTVGRIVIKK